MKKVLTVVIVALLCLVVLAGCSTYDEFIDSGVDEQGIVKWASISLSAKEKEMSNTISRILEQATKYSAQVTNQYVYRNENGISEATYTFAVSKDNFDSFVEGLSNCGKVNGITTTQDNYSEQIKDVNNQIEVLTNQKAQYQALLTQSTDIEEKVMLIEKIAEIDRQLLSLQDQAGDMGIKDYYLVNVHLTKINNGAIIGAIFAVLIFVGFWAGLIILIIKISKSKPANKSSNN